MTAGPLAGRRYLLTRRKEQSAALRRRLEQDGAEVVEAPLIRNEAPSDPGALDRALGSLARYDWVAVTSGNTARVLRERLDRLGLPWPLGDVPQLASIGASTSRALAEHLPGWNVVLQPAAGFSGAALLSAFAERGVTSGRVLLPASDLARDELGSGLEARGLEVTRVVAYRTVTDTDAEPLLRHALTRPLDVVVLASPSAVRALVTLLGGEAARSLPIAAIGPVTASAARLAGLDLRVVAREADDAGLTAALRSRSG